MKKWMYLIGLAIVLITTGCNTMYGEYDPAVESEWPWETVTPESQGIRVRRPGAYGRAHRTQQSGD